MKGRPREGVLLAKHIPAGIELFTPGDASQLEVIKQWIRESDAYLLVLGARYGSIEPTSGLSYSEIEYDFAVANELPHFALVLNDASNERKHAAGLKRPSAADAAKLSSFRSKAFWGIGKGISAWLHAFTGCKPEPRRLNSIPYSAIAFKDESPSRC
jgi:Domain of unknown function (DUF4062)